MKAHLSRRQPVVTLKQLKTFLEDSNWIDSDGIIFFLEEICLRTDLSIPQWLQKQLEDGRENVDCPDQDG